MVSETPQSWLTEYLPPGSLFKTNISKKPAQEDNAMNKSVTNLWNMHKSPAVSGTASPAASGTATPLEVATPINEELPIISATPAPVPEVTTPAAEPTKSKKRSKNSKEPATAKRPKSKRKDSIIKLFLLKFVFYSYI